MVVNNAAEQIDAPVSAVDDAFRTQTRTLERSRKRDGLKHAAWLKWRRNGQIAASVGQFAGLRREVRVEARVIRHGEDLSGVRIDSDDGTGFSVTGDDSLVQLLFRGVLKIGIYGKDQILARLWLAGDGGIVRILFDVGV